MTNTTKRFVSDDENLMREWHTEKNQTLNPETLTLGSGKKVWWRCKKGHEWEATISKRSLGRGCHYCTGRYAIKGETDLATTHPQLAEEWHPTKNESLTPYNTKSGSHHKVWWQCEKGHEWEAQISSRSRGVGCPYCSGKYAIKGKTDLATTHPHLIKEWHPMKNGSLTPNKVTSGSHKKIWWQCEKGHEWEALICNRSKGSGCIQCKNTGTSFFEQATLYYLSQIFYHTQNRYQFQINQKKFEVDIYVPELNLSVEYDGLYWHQDKEETDRNKSEILKGVTTLVRIRERGLSEIESDYCVFSDKTYFEFEQALYTLFEFILNHFSLENKTIEKIKRVVIHLEEDEIKIMENYRFHKEQGSLESGSFEFISEWHPTKNGTLKPSMFSPFSSREIWWQCEQGHEWKRPIAYRSSGDGCPYCSGRYAIKGETDLATTNPELAKEWHPTKNLPLTVSDVKLGGTQSVWWQCEKGHEWVASPNHRSKDNGRGCPYCANQKVLKGFNDLVTTHLQLAKEWHPYKNHDLPPTQVVAGTKQKVWWQCEKGHEWVAQISSRSQGVGCPYCTNKKVLKGFNDLVTTHPQLAKEWHPTRNLNFSPTEITFGSNQSVWWQCEKGHEWETSPSHRLKDKGNGKGRGRGCPYCANRKVLKGFNDLATTHPHLISQWHPIKNETLTPFNVTKGSEEEIWWQCEKGHEWVSSVYRRSSGTNCPYCANQKVWPGFNDLATTHPHLISQWHSMKNEMLTPYEVVAGTQKKIWWQCEKGHEWEAQILSRVQGRNCPYCANKKVWPGFNDLATTHPHLMKEWHPIKNETLQPTQVVAGSSKKVWWRCEKGHEWESTIANRSKGRNCPDCAKLKRSNLKLANQ